MAQHFRWHQTPTVVGGAWSGIPTAELAANYKMRPCYMTQCLIRSATANTTFNATVTDDKGFIIRKADTATGVWNDLTPTPVVGNLTIGIDTSSVDEAYQVLIVFTVE